jgi:hypothetical protein
MSVGVKLFSISEISIVSTDDDQDQQLLQKLQSLLLNFDLVVKVINQIYSSCIEVRDQTFLVIGTLIRNGIDLNNLIFDSDALEVILSQIYPAQTAVSLRYLAWCLYIICKRYFQPVPGVTLTEKQMAYLSPTFTKLSELMFRGDATQELMIVVILALGRILHMHPPCDLVNEVFNQMVLTVLNQQNPNPMMCLAVLRCLYDTTRLTRIHS